MNKQRILREAQKIASKYSFWMVSGDISHLYGYILKTPEKEYDLEIIFGNVFPNQPPELILHNNINDLLGAIQLNGINNWEESFKVVDILDELKSRIEDKIKVNNKIEQAEIPIIEKEKETNSQKDEEYITPDLNLYPPEVHEDNFFSSPPSGENLFYTGEKEEPNTSIQNSSISNYEDLDLEKNQISQDELFINSDNSSVKINTELGLIQQEFACDIKEDNRADIIVYMTITLTKTFLIHINFSNYPKKPEIIFPDDLKSFLNKPNQALETLKNWSDRNPPHIIDILHELEKQLYSIKEIEKQLSKISQEYQYKSLSGNITLIQVTLLTYGFKEYTVKIDISNFPKPPTIILSSELQNLIRIPISKLNSIKSWEEGKSEPIEVIREINWLVDKNSRINFELDLLNTTNEKVNYDPLTHSLNIRMKGKMKTKDLTFEFRIQLPSDYPMSMPEISIVNKFEFGSQEEIKQTLNESFDDFFNEWTPYSYLIDLFNLISKKIFEVSAVSCVICHQIECPTCRLKIAGPGENCYVECPHCERPYHKHCWEQTIKSFGKCGFCLQPP
jgi:ubiquitin-protein ligase